MKEVQLIATNYVSRMKEILDEAWKIFKAQFIYKRNDIDKEAPFQLQFASIIKNVGELYSIKPGEQFFVGMETKCEDIKEDGKPKYVDITCGFRSGNEPEFSCAIELKFKTRQQSAQDIGRINVYQDLEALEQVCRKGGYDIGKFYMITDSRVYTVMGKGEVADQFMIYDGYLTDGNTIHIHDEPEWKNNKYCKVELKNQYKFEWEHSERCDDKKNNLKDWYFLELDITK